MRVASCRRACPSESRGQDRRSLPRDRDGEFTGRTNRKVPCEIERAARLARSSDLVFDGHRSGRPPTIDDGTSARSSRETDPTGALSREFGKLHISRRSNTLRFARRCLGRDADPSGKRISLHQTTPSTARCSVQMLLVTGHRLRLRMREYFVRSGGARLRTSSATGRSASRIARLSCRRTAACERYSHCNGLHHSDWNKPKPWPNALHAQITDTREQVHRVGG